MWGSRLKKIAKPRGQAGTVMVEMALTSVLFFGLIFAVFEMAIIVFTWAKAGEAMRAAARQAIVTSPVVSLSTLDCTGTTSISISCDSANCSQIMPIVTSFLPSATASNVNVTYRCSTTGFPGRPQSIAIRDVTVSLTGLLYSFVVPNLLGLGPSIEVPSFATTRTGEDLFTN